MAELGRTTECVCGGPVSEVPGLAESQRQPCPACGSTARVVGIGLSAQVTMHGSLRMKARHGNSRPFLDQFVGADFWRASGRWVAKVRRIDRDGDRYDEVVTDGETGEVVHEEHEPLSEHRGHGSVGRL